MTTKTTYKVGDKVRILNAEGIGACEAKDGDILEVIDVDSDNYPILKDVDGERLFMLTSELKYIEKVAEQVAKFNVGDKVRAVTESNARYGVTTEENGWTGVIASVDDDGKFDAGTLTPKSEEGCEYTGLEPKYFVLISQKPTKSQRLSAHDKAITALEQTVASLQAEVEALKAAQKPKNVLSGEGTLICDGKPIAKVRGISFEESTPNEQRKAIIAEAKAFVEEYESACNSVRKYRGDVGNGLINQVPMRIKFEVNAEKRAVTALFYAKTDDTLRIKGIAKCAPDDVFNADIGKAIALGRALGLDVKRFEQAVQPTEVVAGMSVMNTGSAGGTYKIVKVDGDDLDIDFKGRYFERKYGVIKDDTEAQY